MPTIVITGFAKKNLSFDEQDFGLRDIELKIKE
jgi:hypothetical protein